MKPSETTDLEASEDEKSHATIHNEGTSTSELPRAELDFPVCARYHLRHSNTF